jgi:hypothetical protein
MLRIGIEENKVLSSLRMFDTRQLTTGHPRLPRLRLQGLRPRCHSLAKIFAIKILIVRMFDIPQSLHRPGDNSRSLVATARKNEVARMVLRKRRLQMLARPRNLVDGGAAEAVAEEEIRIIIAAPLLMLRR